ncbi:MAG: DUF4240 domain-containing protein [Oscillibacter sp.]|nr:DUF4240 domain-containing protein [Oscillibacter sp.]
MSQTITKNTFWDFIDEAREHSGGEQANFVSWLEDQLLFIGNVSEAVDFQNYMDAYMDLSDCYGLRTAAAVMLGHCSEAEFHGFRAWLISQGREVYLAALKDPDALATVVPDNCCSFPSLSRLGRTAYAHMTGRPFHSGLNAEEYHALTEELRREIVYGEGIHYPYEWRDVATYLPRLCAKYLTRDALEWNIGHRKLWDNADPSVQLARNTASKSKKVRLDAPIRAMVETITPDTFWTLLAEAKRVCGQDLNASAKWLEDQLLAMDPRQARNFHDIFHAYLDLAEKYGLWTAAAVMERGCSDDGFIDFRAWLIAQGKDVYLAALRDPDTLADVEPYGNCFFEALCYTGYSAYEKLTGRNAYDDTDRGAFRTLTEDLRREIRYGDGIGYPYEWKDAAAYLPKLCAKYLSPDVLADLVQDGRMWNPGSRDIREAKETAAKSKRVRQTGAR